MSTCCQGVNQGGQTSCSAVGFSVKLKREMSNIVCIAFKLVCYLLVFIKCLKSSHLLSNLCHHNDFSLCDVFVNQVDIGKSLWVVIAVIVVNKELPSVVRQHHTWKHCCHSWWDHSNKQDMAVPYYKSNWIQPHTFCILLAGLQL